ncbi:preprotein translocase subunit SecG [Sphingomonas lenta]|uniref:Protein-export membrane protein SecG n=1 Tax=Sphingomonas lenta TaxID=1141887 RepID=A0A2A2SL89_9SPHN|nr:preprotein translocase subunit SecG [Sphingomonas lenta]PAX09791.1 preprotein translocase subunit SecG [Sphingomonas lenta]
MFAFLLVVHAIIAAALVTVILMQRSEGGGLGMGGSPSGLMSARGAADFLTRATAVLATVFVTMSIVLAVLAATRQTETVDTSLARRPGTPAAAPIRPTEPIQADDAPFATAAGNAAALPADNSQTQLP